MPLHEPHPVLVSEVIDGGELQLGVGPMRTELDLVAYAPDFMEERAMPHELEFVGFGGEIPRLYKRITRIVSDVSEG